MPLPLIAVAVVLAFGTLSRSATSELPTRPQTSGPLAERIMALPVWDTHNHLTGPFFKAQDFYDLGHYFWFLRELNAAGYPGLPPKSDDGDPLPDPLSEQERAEAFLKALKLSANTTWSQVFRQGIRDLFGVELETPEDIFEINEILKQTREDPEWSAKVLDNIGVKRLSVRWHARNRENGILEVDDRLHFYEIINPCGREDLGAIISARNSGEAAAEVLEKKKTQLDNLLADGVRVFRFRLNVTNSDQGSLMEKPDITRIGNDLWRIRQFLTHSILEYLNDKDVHLQLFFQVSRLLPVNDPDRVLDWDPLFEKYDGITFELFAASHIHSLDMVQVARNNRNVYPAGMWWLTYRRSQFLENMQHRLEALPASRSTFVASDARRVEWVYLKILMQKRVLIQFMEDQVADGWLTEDQAVEAARWWLFDTVAALYEGEPD